VLPATDEVVLKRVTLRGPAEAIDAARAPIKTALEQTCWPSTAPGELLFLRRISASGNPREIAARAADQARRLAGNAVDGGSAAAPNALAVRFHNRASLLACLIRDLLHGTAQRHWYWRRWQSVLQRPLDEALVTLLQEAPLHLPAVVAQLRTTSAWQPFWQGLGKTGAERLLTVTAQATGWSNTVQAARTLVAAGGATAEQAATPLAAGTQPIGLSFLSADGIIAANDPRPLLAALLTLWQQSPARLNQPLAAQQLLHLARVISGEATIKTEQNGSPDGVKRNPGIISPDSTTFHPGYSAVEELGNGPADPLSSAASTPGDIAQSASSPQLEIAAQGAVNRAEKAPASITAESTRYQPLFEHNFITRQGGLFFLLNFLKLPAAQALLPADQPGAGWRGLHDLATALGCPPEEALLDYLASQCGMESGAELAQQPPLAAMAQWLRLGAGRYGDEVWQAGTWQIPARLIATASHIDLHFRLNDASLAVRRVGLDLDPGWLPWLGKIVSFHYGSGLEPEG
jgi:hypothetical protein